MSQTFVSDGRAMICPRCGGSRLRVLSTRAHRGVVRRRRSCVDCQARFYTGEFICDADCENVHLLTEKEI
jgi:transcriptional regulator NrdR family protein